MDKMPEVKRFDNGGSIWKNTFSNFEATVYTPEAKKELLSDTINYGFIAPYLLVFPERHLSFEEAMDFSDKMGFSRLAEDFATSVVFISPLCKDWADAPSDIFSNIISNSKIGQYYKDGCLRFWNFFTRKDEGYYIRGAIFRTCLFAFGKSADYIAKNCLKHFEGDGLWGKSDLAPVTCFLSGLSTKPVIQADDIPILSYNNSKECDDIFEAACKYFEKKSFPEENYAEVIYRDYYSFAKKFRRMTGPLTLDEDLEKDGLKIEAGIETVKTSADNQGDDRGSSEHKIGYVAFYNKALKGPLPLVLGFHGGGDSSFFLSIMAGWAKIAHRHNFLFVAIENHINSTASEMLEFTEKLKKKYQIDSSRIYATGFSMGGIKTWDIIQEVPQLIAAAAPMDATVDVGQNVYFTQSPCSPNRTKAVPVFYAGGEISPLPELPYQDQRCINRMKYALELNGAQKEYKVSLGNKDNWENKLWGISGDITEKKFDASRNATLTMEKFKNKEGKILNVFASISGQGHDCREHTCEQAWLFMSGFSK